MSSLLPFPADAVLPDDVLQRLGEAPPLNVYRMLAHAPHSLVPWTNTVRSIYQGALSPRQREIAILRQGARAGAPYEVHQHAHIARSIGLTDAEIEEILAPAPVRSLSTKENLICAIADQLEGKAALDDQTFEQAQADLGVSLFVELILVISFYSGVARFVNGTRISIEDSNPLKGLASPN